MERGKDEDLSRYVSRVMALKGYSPSDVAQRSGRRITAAYVTNLMMGVAKNPSIEKLNALALGLGIDSVDLFNVASGLSKEQDETGEPIDTSHALMIIEMMQKVAADPEMTELMMEALRLTPEDREVILHSMRALNRNCPLPRRAKEAI